MADNQRPEPLHLGVIPTTLTFPQRARGQTNDQVTAADLLDGHSWWATVGSTKG